MDPERHALDRLQSKHIIEWFGFSTALALAAGAIVVVYQAVSWLKTGDWPPQSIFTALNWLGVNTAPAVFTSWRGFNIIAAWILDLHVSVAFFGIGVFVGIGTSQVSYLISRSLARSAA